MSRVVLEICVESVTGAVAAIEGGCDRIELCSALALGGLTPSAGLVAAVLDAARPAGVPVHAMVRPRAGGFDYDGDMVALAMQEAAALAAAGVQGLVFGATRDGALDRAALSAWVDALPVPRPSLTLHRAIDVTDDPAEAVEVAIALGFDRILTSGGARSALAGSATIAAMVARAAGRCAIIAGAGVAPANVAALIADTGVGEVHGSASVASGEGGADTGVDADPLCFGPMPRITSPMIVTALRRAIDDKSNIGQLYI